MAKLWVYPQFPKGRVDWAGDVLIDPFASATDKDLALTIMGNWRSSHSYPLQALKMTLRTRAKQSDRKANVVQRLKRLPSVTAKLIRNRNMHLSQMQDIGGCRAVVRDIRAVNKLVSLYTQSYSKNPKARAEFVKPFDYINHPKIDGYRGIHLIYKYRSKSKRHKVWNGLRIEIQIRSKLQHAWATAVETVDAFTGQGLKVSGGTGTEKKDWGRFFALMSSAIACKEKCPLVPNTPPEREELFQELKGLSQQLRVGSRLAGWSYAMGHLKPQAPPDEVLFILILDTEKYEFEWQGFKRSEIKQAQSEYLRIERDFQQTPSKQVVLVSADSMDAVRAAYPNFYADTRSFINALQDALREVRNGKNEEINETKEAVE